MATLGGMTYTYPAPPMRPKKKSRVWLVILAIVAVLVVGCGIAAFVIANAGVQAVNEAASAAAAATGESQGTGAEPTKQAPLPPGQVGEGRLEVGKDIEPGTYKATVPTESVGCYWARLKDMSGEAASILANGIGQPGSKVTVTIKPTDKGFETQGCGNWTKSA